MKALFIGGTGFSPCIRFEQGIKKTLDNIMAHPELQIADPEYDKWCDRVIEALETAKTQIINNQ